MRREWMQGVFPRHRFQRKLRVSDPGMHHGTWRMSGSPTQGGGGENVPGIPSVCVTHSFAYLTRGSWAILIEIQYMIAHSSGRLFSSNSITPFHNASAHQYPIPEWFIKNNPLMVVTIQWLCETEQWTLRQIHHTFVWSQIINRTLKWILNKNYAACPIQPHIFSNAFPHVWFQCSVCSNSKTCLILQLIFLVNVLKINGWIAILSKNSCCLKKSYQCAVIVQNSLIPLTCLFAFC